MNNYEDNNNNNFILEGSAYSEAYKAFQESNEEFLNPKNQLENVVGLAIGLKQKNNQAVREPALQVLVERKLPRDMVPNSQLIPARLGGLQTDVVEVGILQAGSFMSSQQQAQQNNMNPNYAAEFYQQTTGYAVPQNNNSQQTVWNNQISGNSETLARRVRPVQGGYSVGHKNVTAGTIATCVYDIQPGGTTSPPQAGTGIPTKYYILSNNHVLANSNNAAIGDQILQPGAFDGGTLPADVIARLERFIPIQFAPSIPLNQQNNLVDAAIAAGDFDQLNREIYWIGNVRGWRRRSMVSVGTRVQKTGRTTHFTTGTIQAVNATVDVNYGGGKVARFKDQIITSRMSAPGDSGSLITTTDNVAVGLLFAGSSLVTIANQIENVRTLLRIEVAENIL